GELEPVVAMGAFVLVLLAADTSPEQRPAFRRRGQPRGRLLVRIGFAGGRGQVLPPRGRRVPVGALSGVVHGIVSGGGPPAAGGEDVGGRGGVHRGHRRRVALGLGRGLGSRRGGRSFRRRCGLRPGRRLGRRAPEGHVAAGDLHFVLERQ